MDNFDYDSIDARYISNLVHSGKVDEALKVCNTMIENEHTRSNGYSYRSFVYSLTKRIDLAIRDISAALNIGPRLSFDLLTRGILYLQEGDFYFALDDFTESIAVDIEDNSKESLNLSYFFRAIVYCELGEFEKAVEDCLKVPESMREYYKGVKTKQDVLQWAKSNL